MKLVTAILDSSSQTSLGVRNLETTHFPLYSRLGQKGGAVECRPSRNIREARLWIASDNRSGARWSRDRTGGSSQSSPRFPLTGTSEFIESLSRTERTQIKE